MSHRQQLLKQPIRPWVLLEVFSIILLDVFMFSYTPQAWT